MKRKRKLINSLWTIALLLIKINSYSQFSSLDRYLTPNQFGVVYPQKSSSAFIDLLTQKQIGKKVCNPTIILLSFKEARLSALFFVTKHVFVFHQKTQFPFVNEKRKIKKKKKHLKLFKLQSLSNNPVTNDNSGFFKVETEPNHRLNFMKNVVIFFIVCIILISSFILLKRKNNLLNKKAKEIETIRCQLRKKDKALIKLNEKEKLVKEIKDGLKEITLLTSIDLQNKKIKETLKKINIRSSCNLFDTSYETLLVRYPQFFELCSVQLDFLTEMEQVVMFYSYLNFSNSEIATILNKSLRSVESVKYRTRKKINLSNQPKSLTDKLQEIFTEHVIMND